MCTISTASSDNGKHAVARRERLMMAVKGKEDAYLCRGGKAGAGLSEPSSLASRSVSATRY
jgi:hypothetical protein